MGTGTINVYAGGLLNVEAYAIGSYGTGRIYITPGGTMTIKGDVRTQVNADKAAHKIAGAGGAVITATYNAARTRRMLPLQAADRHQHRFTKVMSL